MSPQENPQSLPVEPHSLPRVVWALGFVSLLMDISSEMIHSLLPVFLVTVLGAGTATVGLIEGVGEATASISKLFSGWISDRLGRRKTLTAIGYALGALSKPLFALAPTASWVLVARFSDRIGKGIRGAPRDALIGDLVRPELRGAAYGLRQSLDTIGAFLGPLIALALMEASGNSFRLVMWLALFPGVASVVVLIVSVHEPSRPASTGTARPPIRWAERRRLSAFFWGVVIVGAILTLARFSEAFLILRAQGVGLPIALVPLVLVLMNVVYAASAYPAGALSDRLGRNGLLACGFGVLIIADAMLALATGLTLVAAGVILWGLHMGLTQGLLAALVADSAPAELRGTAFGVFNLVGGVMLLLASLIAGILWDLVGPRATFIAGAAFTAIALAGAVPLIMRAPRAVSADR